MPDFNENKKVKLLRNPLTRIHGIHKSTTDISQINQFGKGNKK